MSAASTRVAVLGAGAVGTAVAGDLALRGCSVALWNRGKTAIEPFLPGREIRLSGAIEATAKLRLISCDMAEVLEDADLVFVCVPASGHEYVAQTAATHLRNQNTVVLTPGRTFGALAFANAATQAGMKARPAVAEMQTTPFSCRRRESNHVLVLSRKRGVQTAALDVDRKPQIDGAMRAADCENYEFVDSTLTTSMNNVGPLLHCPTMLLNVGWMETAGPRFKFYAQCITPRIAALIERVDLERMAVCRSLDLSADSIRDWGARTYNVHGVNLYEAIQANVSYGPIESPDTLDHRYLTEDVPTGLVPWESLGHSLGLATPLVTMLIDLASALLNRDFRATGRTLDHLGFTSAQALARALRGAH